MVKPKNQCIFSPTVAVAITMAVFIYTGIIPISDKNAFKSIVPVESIESIDGYILSNPAKVSTGNYYSAKLEAVSSQSSSIISSSEGNVQILVPSEIVEALYPGKLYSKVYELAGIRSPLIEQGLHITVYGYFLQQEEGSSNAPIFLVSGVYERGWKNTISKMRAHARLTFKKIVYAWGDAGGLLLALLTGSREYTNTSLSEGFKNAGLSHILALSGMHLSLFTGLAFMGGSFVAGKKVGTVLSLLAVLVFVWFAGLSPSLFRALLCTLISFVLQYCALPGISGNSEIIFRFIAPSFSSIRLMRVLSLSFLIHICLFPMDMHSPAFMLSYGALTGIAIAEFTIKPYIVRFLHPILSSPLCASLGAQLFTAPATLGLFGTLMPIGIISSVVVSPLALGFLLFGFFCILLCLLIPFLLYPIGDIIGLAYSILEHVVMWFSNFPPIQL